ncbi:CHASE2 domain-containing protein [Desulforhopalus sp. IMCC35007]|uniref:CHASE2 domain-containing protein n=1 Tax=Desulforhopalus sp. IMCC35007 TaxID=2569543 RepID=UPI00211047D9|nr:adenylate/guanylate cyclase domain-containing protein [Desulforhopalus sp. IMCC35007]
MISQSLQSILRPSAFKAGLLTCISCCLIYFCINHNKPEFISSLDNKLTDFMFYLRGAEPSSGSVVIVDIDEKSLSEYGQWPWPRNLLAELAEKVLSAKPAVVGFDLIFAEKDRCTPLAILGQHQDIFSQPGSGLSSDLNAILSSITDYDKSLGDILDNSKSVQGYSLLFREDFLKNEASEPYVAHPVEPFTGWDFENIQFIAAYRPILNIAELRRGGSEGFLNLFHDENSKVRKAPLFVLLNKTPYPSLAMEMFMTAKTIRSPKLVPGPQQSRRFLPLQGFVINDTFYRTDDYGRLEINFRGPSNTFLYLSASNILNGTETAYLSGKYVLVGITASGMIDQVRTPFSSQMPGVEIHANILDNLIRNDGLISDKTLENQLTYTIILIAGLALSGSLVFLHPFIGLSISGLLFLLIAAGNYFLLFLENNLVGFSFIYLALTAVFLVVTLCNYFFEGRKRLFIKRAFSHYVSPAVVGELLKNPEKLNLLVDNREVTVLFCDIRNFTTLAENTSPAELSLFLNSYFSLLTDIIIKHNGMVDKFIGDAIMAVWGTPLQDPEHASKAVHAALEMAAAVAAHRDTLQLSGQPVRIGIGINSGLVSAGNFGCSRRFDYTVLGDNVNLASRMEGLTRYYPVTILITQQTRALLKRSITCRYIDAVRVKGRVKTVELYEPLEKEKSTLLGTQEYSQYLEALEYYRTRDFQKAALYFDNLFKTHGDPLYHMYRQRCLSFITSPPTLLWSGVYQHS